MDRFKTNHIKADDEVAKTKSARAPRKAKNQASENKVDITLRLVPNDLLVMNVKPKDEALQALIKKVKEYQEADSSAKDITDETPMSEIKQVLKDMPVDQMIECLNEYLMVKHNKISNTKRLIEFSKTHTKLALTMYFCGFILIWLILHVIFPNSIPSPQIILEMYNTMMDANNQDLITP